MSDQHTAAIAVIERSESKALSPVVELGMEIMRQNPSPETLRELLKVQQEWEANEARKAYAAALVALKRDLPTVIARDTTVDFTGNTGKRTYYKHASLAGVMDAITEPLTSHGFSLAWKPTTGQNGVSVTCRLTHQAGHFEETTLSSPPDASGNKSAPQAVASTITLLQRYAALSLLGIATADMEEPKGEAPAGDEVAPSDTRTISTDKNLGCMAWLSKRGKTKDQAEKHVDKPISEWTQADRQELKAWGAKQD